MLKKHENTRRLISMSFSCVKSARRKRTMVYSFTYLTILLGLLILSQSIMHVEASTIYNETDVTISAYSLTYREVSLNQGGGMAGWFQITSGDGIHFFITNTTGHDVVQISGRTDMNFKMDDYAQMEGWYYWNFTAPHADTWYIYFSNWIGTAYAGIEDTIDIIIKTETDPPVIDAAPLPSQVSGIVNIQFTAVDDCFPIDYVELYIDGNLSATIFNENTVNGYRFSDAFEWDTNLIANGNYSVMLMAYDTFGRASNPLNLGLVEVSNNVDLGGMVLVGGMVVVVVMACVLSQRRR